MVILDVVYVKTGSIAQFGHGGDGCEKIVQKKIYIFTLVYVRYNFGCLIRACRGLSVRMLWVQNLMNILVVVLIKYNFAYLHAGNCQGGKYGYKAR